MNTVVHETCSLPQILKYVPLKINFLLKMKYHFVMKLLYKILKFTPSELPKKIKKKRVYQFSTKLNFSPACPATGKKISQHSGKEEHYFPCVYDKNIVFCIQ